MVCMRYCAVLLYVFMVLLQHEYIISTARVGSVSLSLGFVQQSIMYVREYADLRDLVDVVVIVKKYKIMLDKIRNVMYGAPRQPPCRLFGNGCYTFNLSQI